MIKTCPFSLEHANIRVLWEITSKCNLKCRHCMYYENNNSAQKDLTLEQIKMIVDQIAEQKLIKEVWLSGGEPLVRNDIVEIIQYISNAGLTPSLSSNGTLLTEKMAKGLFKAGIRYVHVSIDGTEAVTHDALRGVEGAFNRTIEGVRYMHEAGIMTGASFMVTEESIDQVGEMVELAQKLELSIMSFYLVESLGRAKECSFGDRKILAEKLKQWKTQLEQKANIPRLEFLRLDCSENDILEPCHAEKFLTITSDGRMGLCPWLMKSQGLDYTGEDILNQGVREAYDHCQTFAEILKVSRKNNDKCICCSDAERCGQGCPAVSVYDDVNPYGFDNICSRA